MISIKEIRDKSADVFNLYPINKVFLFGSYARGEQTEGSDIDMLIADSKVNILDISNLRQSLSDIFNVKVDLVCENEVSDVFKFLISDDEVLIFEKSR